MATIDRTKIAKPSPIVEDEQGQLRARQGISREVVSELSRIKGEPDWMAEKRLQVAGDLRTQADPDVGPGPGRPEPRRPRAVLAPDGRALQQLGRRAGGDEADLRGPRHPPGRARAPRGRGRRVAPGARVRGPEGGVRQAGDPVLLDGHGHHRVPGAGAEVLHEQVRAAAGQQVLGAARRRVVGRRLLLRPQGRQVRPAAAVLLPHGGRRRGHLRAHADRRRRGLRGELHRGLHRADLQRQLDALGGRGDLRARGRQGALHDRAELVQGRLQPQHQARRRGRRGHGRVGRRLDGREVRDALPGLVPDGRGRARRPPQRGRGGQGRAQGHRRQGRAPGAEHDLQHPRQVDLQGRRHHGLPRPGQDGPQLRRLESPRAVRRADDGRRIPLGHAGRTSRSRTRT